MISLQHDDRRQLVRILQNLPLMEQERTRRRLIEDAGLEQVLPTLDLSGSPFVAAGTIVNDLAQYGQITHGNEALGLLLNTVKEYVRVEQKELIDTLLMDYAMMAPTVTTAPLDHWQAPHTDETVLEKLFGENTLRPIVFLAQGLESARAVAQVRVTTALKQWTGTGFLISPTLFMTNHHVIPSADLLANVEIRFNYQETLLGQVAKIVTLHANPTGHFHTNAALDYTVCEMAEEAGTTWGFLPLSNNGVVKGQRINIIQHPNGQPKQITFQNNLIEYVDAKVMQYVTTTSGGSSGAPALTDKWQVAGIHHAGGRLQEPTTRRYYNRNESIRIEPIINDLPNTIRQELPAANHA